jgi:ribosomal protein L27
MATKSYSADQARGGEIILRQRWEKIIFLGGLAGTVLLLVLAQFIWP